MTTPEIVTGDDVALSVTLKKDNATFTITPTAEVKAALVSTDRTKVLANEVAQSSAAEGADWANSLVVVEFSATETATVTNTGRALLEIQVDDGGKRTWFIAVLIVQGNIP